MKPKWFALLLVASFLIFALNTSPALANVPSVTDVIAWTRQSDNHTILNITIFHSGYYPGHYVDWVQVDVSGTIHKIDMTASSPVDQTTSSTFTVTYDLGVISGNPTVQAEAHCTIHGTGAWSPLTTVPELSPFMLILALASLTTVASLFRKRRQLTEQ